MQADFAVIPVLDLMSGRVVHGKAGERRSYAPVQTPFGDAETPIEIARNLLQVTRSGILYVADIDAIQGQGGHLELCAVMAAELPEAEIWVDAGTSDPAAAADLRRARLVPVIGSETLHDVEQWQALRAADPDLVLSLDFDGARFLGPERLFARSELWPAKLIVMSLTLVGMGGGPNLDRLVSLKQKAGNARALYSAGGVRDGADLQAAADAGAAGVLIATSLHRGAVTEKEIAALLRRRRFRNQAHASPKAACE